VRGGSARVRATGSATVRCRAEALLDLRDWHHVRRRGQRTGLSAFHSTGDLEGGNLIAGYDEGGGERTGSNNLVFGREQTYTSYGALIGGNGNFDKEKEIEASEEDGVSP
jgi:hypothetical protein